jgi:DNA-binding CsgD family transcriptional regulator
MEATYQTVLDEGDEGSIPYALSHLPLLEFAAGNWSRAEEVARQYLAVSIELGHESQRVSALFALANVLAHQGREAEARPLIEELLRDAERAGSLWDVTKGLTALGALELSLGRSDIAADHLLRADAGWKAMRDEIHGRHEADLVEALVEAGRIDEAAEVAAAIDGRARRYGRHSRLAIAARGRGLVSAAAGQMDAAIVALEEALREHAQAPFPFDVARTQLVLGRVRRRRRERTLAKQAFDEALPTFEGLGAALWAVRTRGELERVGLRRGAGPALTEGERRVAELAATGLTNREVAAALFLSPKTVEVNLSRAYEKLGVRSRAELGALAAQGALEVPDRT